MSGRQEAFEYFTGNPCPGKEPTMKKLFVGNGEVKVDADALELDSRVAMIQALIPIGLEAVDDVL